MHGHGSGWDGSGVIADDCMVNENYYYLFIFLIAIVMWPGVIADDCMALCSINAALAWQCIIHA